MNSCDERIEKILNRAGKTISDLPKGNREKGAYPGKKVDAMQEVCRFDKLLDVSDVGILNCLDYILHLTDVIDRFETALENQVTLHENLMHVIGNADIPDGVSYDQFCLVTDSIYKAIQTAQEGWENYEEGVPKDWSVDDADI